MISPCPTLSTCPESFSGTILGAFYYGYMVMQIPGGWLGQRFGGTRVFGICLGIASVLTMLTPLAARTSVAALITLRVIEGLTLVSFICRYIESCIPGDAGGMRYSYIANTGLSWQKCSCVELKGQCCE